MINLELPSGYHLNPAAPQRYQVKVESGAKLLQVGSGNLVEPTVSQTVKNVTLPIRVPVRSLATGAVNLRVQFSFVYCREDNTGTCRIKTLVWRVPIEVTKDPGAFREIKVVGKVPGD
jgi:hypothetical protein